MLPCFVRHAHGEVGSTLIFDLPALVDERLRAREIEAIHALAFVATDDTGLETLIKIQGETQGGEMVQ